MIHIGIDTSNYKTSIAAVDGAGQIVCNISEYLDVPPGDRGLRQSEAFFRHSNKLPEYFTALLKDIDPDDIASIGVSDKPRRVSGSYMPCFLAGLNLAKIISEVYKAPLYTFSHQEGHAAAILESDVNSSVPQRSILMHLSGGTTEILKCSMDGSGYAMDIIGGTLDISIGQLLDRFGVALGFPFPAGKYIDELASGYDHGELPGIIPGIRILDGYFNLSGPERVLMDFARTFRQKSDTDEISDDHRYLHTDDLIALSYELIDRIADVLLISSGYLSEEYDLDTVYMAGGVASSSVLRKIIKNKHYERRGDKFNIIFGDPALSGDNAVGIALLAGRMYNSKK